MPLEVELVTNARCAGARCRGCALAEDAVRTVAAERGVAVPAGAAAEFRVLAGFGADATIAVHHLSCEEAPELADREVPLVRVNGRVVLSGPDWGPADLRAALARALAEEEGTEPARGKSGGRGTHRDAKGT